MDAEALYLALRDYLKGLGDVRLVGIASGGAWLVERLANDLQQAVGVISSTMHRDDFAQRGLASSQHTQLPFDVQGAHIVLVDDVLYTGRTIRAVLNELFDYGRPATVRLAVLVDRGERELPITADFAAHRASLSAEQKLSLTRNDVGTLAFSLEG